MYADARYIDAVIVSQLPQDDKEMYKKPLRTLLAAVGKVW